MFMNLPLVSMNMLNILEIDVAIVIFPILHINFAKIHIDSKVVLLMTLLFSMIVSLVKIFHLSVMNCVILLSYRWEIDAFYNAPSP